MAKIQAAAYAAKQGIRVARDPHPASAKVQRAVDRRLTAVLRETAKIKAKRSAA